MINRAAFYINRTKQTAFETAWECTKLCSKHGIEPIFLERDRSMWEAFLTGTVPSCRYAEEPCAENADVIFVFGGDGTVLRALDEFVSQDLPVLGFNLGRVGFLPVVETKDMDSALDMLTEGEYQIGHRMMLDFQASSRDGNFSGYATNEVSISRGLSQRMIAMDVRADGALVEHYIADGVLVAAPTGSTAYSLSAGGPIIAPDVDCLLINPICPHSLASRPIILSDCAEIEIVLNMREERPGIQFSSDGANICELALGDRVVVRRSKHDALMVRFHGEKNFFHLLKDKLSQWSL